MTNMFMVMYTSATDLPAGGLPRYGPHHGETRTTRTPPHDYPYNCVILDAKSKEDKDKVTNFKNLSKFEFFKF